MAGARAAGIVAGLCGIVALSQDPFGFIFTLYTLFVGVIVLAMTVWRQPAVSAGFEPVSPEELKS